MDDVLFNRRKRMIWLLGMRNKPSTVFKVVANEFNVTVDAVRQDYYRMKNWIHTVEQEEQATAIALECMDFGVRQAADLLLSIQPETPDGRLSLKQGFLKVAAINIYTKAVVEENHFKQTLGVIAHKPEVVINQNMSVDSPFEADPVLRQALEAEIEKQRAEKEAFERAKAERDAAAKPADAAGP